MDAAATGATAVKEIVAAGIPAAGLSGDALEGSG
jgi:hypothetical protein